ncbi:hypothetical protein KKQ10_11830 [Pseudomonas sp. MG-9]|uniref:Uncharacterized protein n=1 Tax=Pseudomonas serboccidentalis TaxID=2964670 RepID=A0ABY7Z3Q3_9PSED|nr:MULTISPECIES: hypothetical protein [Pseudomonas]MBT9265570.1 hypothetical protein [Pseudomonas sp. MG-9]WDR33593.1 hypothetical protein NN484_13790 [Pseudomonas serboccidentalis]
MEWLKTFSTDYANAVTAAIALIALVITAVTLYYLRREYRAKYRPYVVPVVNVEPLDRGEGEIVYVVSVRPFNVGPHPCFVMMTAVQLQIGDEVYETPSHKGWSLIGQSGAAYTFPVGHINQNGISAVREGRYRLNRIEVRFRLHSKSVDDTHKQDQQFIFEVLAQNPPLAVIRPEWVSDTRP